MAGKSQQWAFLSTWQFPESAGVSAGITVSDLALGRIRACATNLPRSSNRMGPGTWRIAPRCPAQMGKEKHKKNVWRTYGRRLR